jgi:Uncharacterized ABC-type transport system, periplasmic component/surface lipoprotein
MKKIWLVFIALAVFLTACGGGKAQEEQGASGGNGSDANKETKIALILPEKIGVNPFFQLMDEGLRKAGEEFGVTVKTIESTDANALEQNLRSAVADKYDLIITSTFQAEDALKKLAAENPDQKFAIIDTVVDMPNVRSVVFREYEASYLMGALAGLITKSGTVGMVAADDIPLLKKYTVPFEEGLKSTNPDAKFIINYVGGANAFNDPAKAKELALLQHSQGADFIAGASAAGDFGVFEAAKEKNFYTSGQDMDHTGTDPDHIILSQLKGTDAAAYETVKAFVEGNFETGVAVDYGLKENGVGVTYVTHESATPLNPFIGQENIDKVKELKDKIVSGELTVNDPLKQQ